MVLSAEYDNPRRPLTPLYQRQPAQPVVKETKAAKWNFLPRRGQHVHIKAENGPEPVVGTIQNVSMINEQITVALPNSLQIMHAPFGDKRVAAMPREKAASIRPSSRRSARLWSAPPRIDRNSAVGAPETPKRKAAPDPAPRRAPSQKRLWSAPPRMGESGRNHGVGEYDYGRSRRLRLGERHECHPETPPEFRTRRPQRKSEDAHFDAYTTWENKRYAGSGYPRYSLTHYRGIFGRIAPADMVRKNPNQWLRNLPDHRGSC